MSDALTAALSYTGLRRFAQDRVAREIAIEAERRADAELTTAVGVIVGAVVVFVLVLGLGVTVSRSISRPLRRLTRGAAVVAELARAELVRVSDSDSPDPAPPRLAAVEVDSADEIGELAAALNRVQATAALLLERQVTHPRNVVGDVRQHRPADPEPGRPAARAHRRPGAQRAQPRRCCSASTGSTT